MPKWNPRSCQGKFLGYSKEHATNVGLVLNLQTKRISPQFHVLFDDYFTTVRSVDDATDPVLSDIDWEKLISLVGTDKYFDANDSTTTGPELDEDGFQVKRNVLGDARKIFLVLRVRGSHYLIIRGSYRLQGI